MSPRQALALEMHTHGMNYAQIGRRLGITRARARMLVVIARRWLAKKESR